MVRVVAPDGWVPPAESVPSSSTLESSTSHEEIEFDDVNRILADKSESANRITMRRKPHSTSQATSAPDDLARRDQIQRRENAPNKSQKPTPGDLDQRQPSVGDRPILPGDQWVGTSAKARKKWLIVGTSVSVAFLAIAIATVLILQSKNNDASAKQDTGTSEKVSPAAAIAASNLESKNEQPAGIAKDPTNDAPKGDLDDSNSLAGDSKSEPSPEHANDADSKTIETGTTETSVSEPAEPNDSQPTSDGDNQKPSSSIGTIALPDTGKSKVDTPPPLTSTRDPLADLTDNLSPNEVKSHQNELSELLAEFGTSIREINDVAAAHRESHLIGLPKFEIVRPNPIDPKIFQKLNDPCLGIQYKGASLSMIVRELTQVTGVPITIEAESLRASGFDWSEPFDVNLSDTDFAGAISSLLKQRGLKLVYDGTGPALITVWDRDDNVPFETPVPELDVDLQIDGFVKLTKTLIAPQDWNEEGGPHSIEVSDGKLLIKQTPPTNYLIATFIDKWNTATEIAKRGGSRNSLATTRSLATPHLQKQFEINAKRTTDLTAYLSQVERQTGSIILVNWHALLGEGWNPTTRMPPTVHKQTVEEFLEHLSHSMLLTFRVIDKNVFEMTTFEAAAQAPDLEFYPCEKIRSGQMTADQLSQLLRQSLGIPNQPQTNLRIYFEPAIQTLIAVAPQSIQRQIEAILRRIDGMDN
jgi:hypothetical protein